MSVHWESVKMVVLHMNKCDCAAVKKLEYKLEITELIRYYERTVQKQRIDIFC